MNEYFEIVETEERFVFLQETQLADDNELLHFLQNCDNHSLFNFALLNVGTLLQTISIFFELKQKEIDTALSLDKDKIRDRRMREIVREMNEKIVLRYGLNEDTNIVKQIYVYDNQGYILVSKHEFICALSELNLLEESNMSQM